MKALIFYEDIASAWKARNLLQNSAYCSDIRVNWKISVVRASLLNYPPMADMALKDGLDADLILFAGCRTSPLSLPLREWLERWAGLRLFDHSALALIDDPCPAPSTIQSSDLSLLARKYRLDFITGVESAPTPEVSYDSPGDANSRAPQSFGGAFGSPSPYMGL